ncbi:MAG: cytochrome c [Acidobacteriota bacterium]|nr:cytochrome c [Acidobacteriota bacterium]
MSHRIPSTRRTAAATAAAFTLTALALLAVAPVAPAGAAAEAMAAPAAPAAPAPPAPPDGAKLYKDQCVGCHGADGSGATPMGKALKAGDLRSPAIQGQTDAQLEATVSKGKGKMQAFGKKMSPPEIAAVVTYLRALKAKA